MTEIDDGCYPVPAINSTVYIIMNPYINPFIISYGAISKNVISTSTSFNVNSPAITLNNDDYGGLIKVEDLVEKINNLENALNNLITLYNTHTHVAAGSATSTTSSLDNDVLQITNKEEIENPDIQHGSNQ